MSIAATSGAGPGYTSRVTSGNNNIIEDAMAATPGGYTASAPLASSASWGIVTLAIKGR
jgi:hypothetical protein